jgi:hypothetical protein
MRLGLEPRSSHNSLSLLDLNGFLAAFRDVAPPLPSAGREAWEIPRASFQEEI